MGVQGRCSSARENWHMRHTRRPMTSPMTPPHRASAGHTRGTWSGGQNALEGRAVGPHSPPSASWSEQACFDGQTSAADARYVTHVAFRTQGHAASWNAGRRLPRSGHIPSPHLADFGSTLAEMGPTPSDFWPNVPTFEPSSKDIGLNSNELGPSWTKFGPKSADFDQHRPTSAQIGPDSAKVNPSFTKLTRL